MTDQADYVFKRECKVDSGVLIIENIFSQNRSKADIIRELIENIACLGSEYLVNSN